MKIALFNLLGGESLGLASIATYLEKKGNFKEIRLFDATFDDIYRDTVKYNPDIIGISCFTINYGDAIKLAKKLKKKTHAKIILGGPHISTLPKSLNKIFDAGVIGEGEKTMLELMELFRQKGKFDKNSLTKINGLVFCNQGKIIMTNKREFFKTLDEIPLIDRKYINKRNYTEYKEMEEWFSNTAMIETARGCPYKCIFCTPSLVWGRTRLRSVKSVVKEINLLHSDYNIVNFCVTDDLFICNEKRINEFKTELKKYNLLGKVSFACYARANLFNDSICKLLKKINVKLLSFGFESGSDRVLKLLKGDNVCVKDNERAILLCKKYDFLVSGNILFGSPTEKIEDMEKSLDFLDFCIKHKTRGFMNVFVLTPFPGTPVWEMAKKRGKVSDDMDWNKIQLMDWTNPMLLDESVSFEDFSKIYQRAKKKMRYFHRIVWWQRFKRHPLHTIKMLFSEGRIMKYFLIHKQTDI